MSVARAAVIFIALTLATGPASAAEPFPIAFGGAFALTDHHGNMRSSDEFRGRLMLVYFGYTACPHSCGMALATMSAVLDELGTDADSVAPLFVTVDPEYDTPEHLATYLRNFHPGIVGLTGSVADIAALSKGFHVRAEKVVDTGAFDRLVDHTTFIYLAGLEGEPLSLLPPMLSPGRIAAILRGHL